jgi:GT2 family glycosyltransferase
MSGAPETRPAVAALAADTENVRFSVVIPTMKRPRILEGTLESLRHCDPCPTEVIVVDADPEQSARPVVTRFQDELTPLVRYVHSTPSLTGQRNRGIDESSGDVVVFLDDDVELDASLFGRLGDAYEDASVVGATGRILEDDPGRRLGGQRSRIRRLLPGGGQEGTFTRFGYPRYLYRGDHERDVEYMLGCFMSARRETAAEVRFDEALGGYALAEDEDFSYRLSRVGRIRYLPDVVVHHRKLGFSSMDPRAFGRLVVANRSYLFRKNFPQTPLARLQFNLLIFILVAHRLVNREWSGARGVIEGAFRERHRHA